MSLPPVVARPVRAARPPITPVVPLVLAAASWGVGTALSKSAVSAVPALILLPLQLAVSVAGLLVLARVRGIQVRDRSRPALLGRLGILNPGLAYALGLAGLASVSTSIAVVLWATEPIAIALLDAATGGRFDRRALIGAALALVGIVLVVGGPGGSVDLGGAALILLAVACCATYSVATARRLGDAPSTLGVVFSQQAHALGFAIVLVAVARLAGGADPVGIVGSIGGGAWTSVAASGLVYYGAAYVCFLAALGRMAVSRAAASFYLVPVFGLLAGGLLGDTLAGGQWVGVAIVLGTVAWLVSSDA